MPALQLQLGIVTKNGVESISSSIRRSKIAAAHVAGVQGKEQGTRYLARMGETYKPYSGRAERETLFILYEPVTKREDIGCILGTTRNIHRSRAHKTQKPSINQGLTDPATSLIGFDD